MESPDKNKRRRITVATIAALILLLLIWGGFTLLNGAQNANEAESDLAVEIETNSSGQEIQATESSNSDDFNVSSSSSTTSETQESIVETETCSILIEGEQIAIPCDMDEVDWAELGLPDLAGGDASEPDNRESQGSDSNDSEGSGGASGRIPAPQPNQSDAAEAPKGDTVWCPTERSEDPELFDYCWEGFVEPTFVFSGIHSCRAGEYQGEKAIEITVRIDLSGGNYKDHYLIGDVRNWDGDNKGYTLRSKGWVIGPNDYEVLVQIPISWYAEATFYPMKNTYQGRPLAGMHHAAMWLYEPIQTKDLPENCWPNN